MTVFAGTDPSLPEPLEFARLTKAIEIKILTRGCQGATFQNWGKYTKRSQNIPNVRKMLFKYTKWPLNIPKFSIARPSKIYRKLGILV
jgi:hypothetical protein